MTKPKTVDEGEELSFDEASELYSDEWVLMKVTGEDAEGWVSGRVLAHAPDRKRLNRVLKRLHKVQPKARVSIFHGGKWGRTGEDLRKAIEEASNRPFVSVNAWG